MVAIWYTMYTHMARNIPTVVDTLLKTRTFEAAVPQTSSYNIINAA